MSWKGRKGEVFTTGHDSRKANQLTLLTVLQKTECLTCKASKLSCSTFLRKIYTNLGGKVFIICLDAHKAQEIFAVMCPVTKVYKPTGTQNSDLVTAAIKGVVVTNDIPKSAYDTKRIFTCGPPPFPFHVWDIFGIVFFPSTERELRKF